MNEHNQDGHHAEIVIVRRKHGGHDGHHGGAWKIAYADFVTAMMAFFLVMWLVNSANEATRAKVASYFNPIKMTDPAPSGKGLKETTNPKHTETKADKDVNGNADKNGDSTDAKDGGKTDEANVSAQKSEDQMMHDPFKAIDSISSEGAGHPSGREVEIASETSGDPFDPKAWEALREGKKSSESSELPALANNGEVNDKEPSSAQKTAAQNPPQSGVDAGKANADLDAPKTGGLIDGKTDGNTATKDQTDSQSAADGKTDMGTPPALKLAEAPAEDVTPKDLPANPANDNTSKDTAATNNMPPAAAAAKAMQNADQALVDQTQKEITEAVKTAGEAESLNVSVKMTDEGLLIVLGDKTGSSMFEIGSAEPTPPLVAVVEAIGKIIQTQQGQVVIRGHTDARQYRTLKFDNWQLSTSRAHMASYMLLRGGLDENRISRIEGYGSTTPVEGSDPLAAENRRVEFLLKR